MAPIIHLACLLAITTITNSYAIHPSNSSPNNQTSRHLEDAASELKRRAGDPTDLSWIKDWAAIGDSFTAGIGSGSVYSQLEPDKKCSRYDYSYPAILSRMFGPGVKTFQFLACSGDKTVNINHQAIDAKIYDQIPYIDKRLDLVLMTAGGNDLCLSDIITTCIMYPFQSESGCTLLLEKAQSNIDNILKDNLKSILNSLNDKMNTNGIVIYNKYAEFFNEETEACATDQDWSFPKLLWFNGLKLTVDRRKKFNKLVAGINNKIQEVVDEVSKDSKTVYKIKTADWNIWPKDGVAGQMCEPGSVGAYPDPKSPDLNFFKPDTQKYGYDHTHDETKRELSPEEEEVYRKLWEVTEARIYDSVLFNSPNPRAVARHNLDKRAPIPPNCPGDGSVPLFGFGLPDRWGRFFHPNEAGHETIASFAMDAIVETRAKVLGVSNPTCTKAKDEFKCWQSDGRKAYVTAAVLDENYKDFCGKVKVPELSSGWDYEWTYAEGTPDQHKMSIKLGDGASEYSKDECLAAMKRIIHSCDGSDPENPMNWKFGGRRIIGEYEYEIYPNSPKTRPWPVIKKTHGDCEGWYKVFYGNYKMHGAGWASADFGKSTLLPNIKGCLGNGVTAWKFEYYDKPDANGNEWGASFNTPIWVRARCFANNKVAFASGGFTDGCKGND
ncbi:hypothetical protein VTL71DRAFT_14831 [Oculimacula yallundae]|uniref:SGNH hydrolase-type esterase domain-containing protein n=1 Tax=Oculimacula yallundae TaxID=86028 RepID=A0ABR4CH47_9HELO